ncbi:MAG: nucleotide exchange factor GrpE [Flammeovirgaceae bacterium]
MAKEHTDDQVTEKNEELGSEEKEEVTPTEEASTDNGEEKEEVKEEVVEEDELTKTQKELQEFKDKYLRLYSEFENFRRRTNKEKVEFLQQANKNLLLELLPVIDDVERADKHYDQENTTLEQVREGYELIYKKLKGVLSKQGLTAMESPVGKDFDTEYHEAVTQFPAPSDDMKGKVIDELEKGYLLGDKVIRFAKVVVGM